MTILVAMDQIDESIRSDSSLEYNIIFKVSNIDRFQRMATKMTK